VTLRSDHSLTLIILAAGMGNRYGGFKQIEPVGPHGEFIINYSIYDALICGFKKVVFVVRPEILEAFRQSIGRQIDTICETAYVVQKLDVLPQGLIAPEGRIKPWGTAQAVWCCREVVDTPFAVLNADDYYGRKSIRVLAESMRNCDPDDETIHLVGFHLVNTLSPYGSVARAVCRVNEQGYLAHIQERTRIAQQPQGCAFTEDGDTWFPLAGDTIVSMNLWGFPPSFLQRIEQAIERFFHTDCIDLLHNEIYLPAVVNELLEEKQVRVRVLPTNERWFGVTYLQDRDQAKEALAKLHKDGSYPDRLFLNEK
jgi:NDP-sugar pyrophosphorylase family protein